MARHVFPAKTGPHLSTSDGWKAELAYGHAAIGGRFDAWPGKA